MRVIYSETRRSTFFSDEALSSLGGYVNRQNLKSWVENNPVKIMEVPLHSERVTAWCVSMQGRIIGPYFLIKMKKQQPLMGNGSKACSQTFSYLKSKIWMKQTSTPNKMERCVTPRGKTCHFCAIFFRKTDFLVLPLDFFLWYHLKETTYRDKLQTSTKLKETIDKEIRCVGSERMKVVFFTV